MKILKTMKGLGREAIRSGFIEMIKKYEYIAALKLDGQIIKFQFSQKVKSQKTIEKVV